METATVPVDLTGFPVAFTSSGSCGLYLVTKFVILLSFMLSVITYHFSFSLCVTINALCYSKSLSAINPYPTNVENRVSS